ncbi:hypothetical protein [Nocardia sp. NPDC004722]
MALSRLPFEFEWDDSIRDVLLDDDDERDMGLAGELSLLRDEAVFGIGVGAAQWVVARVDGVAAAADVLDAVRRVEAMWALAADLRNARLTEPQEYEGQAPAKAEEPLWACRRLLYWIYGAAIDGDELQGDCMSLVLLARHVLGPHEGFATWLSQAIERAKGWYALADDDPDDEDAQLVWRPMPPESFWPSLAPATDDAAQAQVDAFLAGLDPATNPYLCEIR